MPPRLLFAAPPAEAAEIIWLSDSTIAYLNGSSLYALSISYDVSAQLATVKHEATQLVDFPSDVESLSYEPESGRLAFSAAVWQDGDLLNTAHNDEEWEERGTTGVVYDDLFVRSVSDH